MKRFVLIVIAASLFASAASAAPVGECTDYLRTSPPVFATAYSNDFIIEKRFDGEMSSRIWFNEEEADAPEEATRGDGIVTLLDLNTYIGGAIGASVYGPFEQTGDKFAGYYWAGVEFLRPVPSVRFIVAYHNFQMPGADMSGQGAKIIMANKMTGLPGWWFLLGGGFLTNMATELTGDVSAKAQRGGGIGPLGLVVESEMKNAFEFDVGFAYEVGTYTTAGILVTFIDHDELGLSQLLASDKSADIFEARRMSVNVTFFAAAVDLEDLIF